MTPAPHGTPEPFRIELEPHRATIVVAPHGDVDIATAERLEAKLREVIGSGFERVVLDLRAVSFIDSSGLRAVLAARAASLDAGVDLDLVPGSAPVQRLFEITGTTEVLRFVEADAIDRPRD